MCNIFHVYIPEFTLEPLPPATHTPTLSLSRGHKTNFRDRSSLESGHSRDKCYSCYRSRQIMGNLGDHSPSSSTNRIVKSGKCGVKNYKSHYPTNEEF